MRCLFERVGLILPLVVIAHVGVLPRASAHELGGAFAARDAAAAQASATARSAGLRILVIAGEDAVNIVQQRTAVAPVVEVRDRNDQPVAGAVVRFAIRNGRATFSGARSLTAVTNAAGRAVATGLTPTGSGALQIGASAAFQGQTAVATIVQTNVMTVAQAAAAGAGASSSAGASAGGAAGGGAGGGLSAATLGIVGGAAVGGTLVTKEVLGGGTLYKGPFTIRTLATSSNTFNGLPDSTCTTPVTITGTVQMMLDERGDGTVEGEIDAEWTETGSATGPSCPGYTMPDHLGGSISGPSGSIQFSDENRWTDRNELGGNAGIRTQAFSGALSNGVITGSWTMSYQGTLVAPVKPGVTHTEGYPLTAAPVTLTKQ